MKVLNISYIIWLLVLVLLSALIFNTIMVSFDHNEQMYVTAGVLASQGHQLYFDFAYLQTPYLPLIYGQIFRLVDTTSYLFLAKTLTFLFFISAALLLYCIVWQVAKNQILAAGLTILFLLNSTLLRVVEESSNYVLPITLSFLAFYLYLRSREQTRWSSLILLFVGLCLAVATGTKLYYGLLMLPFLITLLRYPRTLSLQQRFYHQLVPFAIGLLVGCLPMLWYLFQDYGLFWFNNVGYHLLNLAWLEVNGYTEGITLVAKLEEAADFLLTIDSALLVVALGLAFLLYHFHRADPDRHKIKPFPHAAPLFLSISIVLASIPAVFIPTPVHGQYYAMPASLLFLPLAVFYPVTDRLGSLVLTRFLWALIILSAIAVAPEFQEDWGQPWVTREVHVKSREIGVAITNHTTSHSTNHTPVPGKVATIAPIFAVEAAYPIYPELATGPFLYRIGDLLTSQQLDRYQATSPKTIASLLAQEPPIAILVSHEESEYAESSYVALEEPLRRFAEENGYFKVDKDFYGSELYLIDRRIDHRSAWPGSDLQ
jgi:hypothetical protein